MAVLLVRFVAHQLEGEAEVSRPRPERVCSAGPRESVRSALAAPCPAAPARRAL